MVFKKLRQIFHGPWRVIMGNMDQLRSDRNGERVSFPADEEEEEDGEEHEQIRLVHTPDPVYLSVMEGENDNHRKGSQSSHVQDVYKTLSVDLNAEKDFTSIQCQNEYYANYLCPKESKESSKLDLYRKFWKSKCKNASPLKCIKSIFPILSWLPNYNWKSDLAYDASAGLTVAVLNIPQGLAYAMLANVDPIVGLYMGFFPVIMYSIFGTSKHVSMGTFAVVCLMTGKVATEKAEYYAQKQNDTTPSSPIYSTTEISTSLSLCVGIYQFLMGVFQLGHLSALLSPDLVSGFTTGCAIHVLTSQIKNLFGLKGGDRRNGIFKIPLTFHDVVLGIPKANVTAVILSVVTISVLFLYNELLKARVSKRIPFPIPIELIAIIIGTLMSRYWITTDAFGISIVSHIPTGLPSPRIPPVEIVPDILVDSLIIAVVAYAISISMVKIFAIKHEYEIRPNQELIAHGTSNAFGSFFSCAPIAVSLSRSVIQDQIGGKTQLAGVFSAGIILFVLLLIGPFFETLPHCILSSLVVVALKGMFLQFADLPKSWKESRINGTIWLVSFLATVFLDIEYGLVLGLFVTLASLLWNSNKLSVIELGQNPHTNLFVERKKHNKFQIQEVPDVKVIKLTGIMNFITAESFLSSVDHILRRKFPPLNTSLSRRLSEKSDFYSSTTKVPTSTIILDFSSVSSVDPSALKSIRTLYDAQTKRGCQVLFAGCPSRILQTMDHCNFFDHINAQHFYPSIEHAIQHLKSLTDTVINEQGENLK